MQIPFYCLNHDDSMAIKRYLGEYVSHDVVRDWRRQYLFTVEELNSMDRKELAITWYNSDVWKKKRWDALVFSFYGGDIGAFLDDVARYIDDRIPRAYLKYHVKGESPSRASVKCDKDGNPTTGLIYHYPENKNPPTYVIGATDRQINYLMALATKNGFHLCSEGITKDEASECISYVLNMKSKPKPTCFQKYFKVCSGNTPKDDSQKKAKREHKLTAEQMEKIEQFAKQEGENIASLFQRIGEDIQCTDFSKTNHHSIHEVRDLIVNIAENRGLQWDKVDSCEDCYHIEGILRISPKPLSYSIGVTINYYDIPTEEIWKKMPIMVIEQFAAITTDHATKNIKKQLISNANR